jgi:hypothetical protein
MASSSRSALTCLSPISTASRVSGRVIRQYSSKPDRHITILGEGLTGLYAAYRLSSSPGIKVTLLDSASRVGGWVDSRNRPVSFTDEQGNLIEGEVTLESGPRSIRPRASRGAPLMLKLVGLSRSSVADDRYEILDWRMRLCLFHIHIQLPRIDSCSIRIPPNSSNYLHHYLHSSPLAIHLSVTCSHPY